ncbi:MAG: ATP-binding cassette domain-containing protein [Phycisphaerales bacterium]
MHTISVKDIVSIHYPARIAGEDFLRICLAILHLGKKHRRPFWSGVFATLFVVGCRIAMPWPIKTIMQPWIDGDQLLPNWGSIAIWGGIFLALATVLGLADLTVRLQFARYAIGAVRDLRSKAFDAVRVNSSHQHGSGDLVARLIGDTARIKAGVKGFLVHVASNSLLLGGITAVLLWLYLPMGVVFGLACCLLALVTAIGAAEMYRRAARYRSREGVLADQINDAVSGSTDSDIFGSLNDESSTAEASLTHAQGRATWAAHAIFGLAVLSAVIVCVRGVALGDVVPSTLVAVAMYAMMLRTPMIQLVRQGTRTGKIAACFERVVQLIDAAASKHQPPPVLRSQLLIRRLKLRADRALRRRLVLEINELEIEAGSKIAIIGKGPAGKTLLLNVLAGRTEPGRGEVLIDGVPIQGLGHAEQVSADPRWPRQQLRTVLGLPPADERDAQAHALLTRLLGKKAVSSLQHGLDTKMDSQDLSLMQRRAVIAVRAVLSRATLLLFDDFSADMSASTSRKRWACVLDACAGRTVIATFRRKPPDALFDRAITLRNARIKSDEKCPTKNPADVLVEGAAF